VLDEGRIVEQGTRDGLLVSGGADAAQVQAGDGSLLD